VSRAADVGRKRSGVNATPRRWLPLPEEAWKLVELCTDSDCGETWLDTVRGMIAVGVAQHLKLDEAETVQLFDREDR
jgi:hypothetical protein